MTGENHLAARQSQGLPWRHEPDDPTGTKRIRSRWSAELYRRMRALKGAVRESVIDRDAFGIGGGENSPGPSGDRPRRAGLSAHTARELAAQQGIDIAPADPNEFAFPSDREKVQGFKDWLDRQVDRGILEVGRAEREVAGGTPWQNTYIRQSYESGVDHADAALTDMGVISEAETIQNAFNAPRHVDGAALVYTRAYNELEGVTTDMGKQMSRELAEGLTQGENPRKIARRMTDRIDKIGVSRARTIARTETVRGHNEGALNRYQAVEGRLDGVTVIAEWSTAQDSDVCVICRSFQGQEFKLDEARGRIPAHPNCRCTWVPVRKQDRNRT